MDKRTIKNEIAGQSLGSVSYDPVKGPSHARQDPVATLCSYTSAHDDAVNLLKDWEHLYGETIPDLDRKSVV